MLKIRRPLGRLIFNMGIAIPGKAVFLIETAPWVRLNIKILSCQDMESHYKYKIVSWPSCLYNGNLHTWKDGLYIESGPKPPSKPLLTSPKQDIIDHHSIEVLLYLDFDIFSCGWWRHQMETFSAWLALCVGNSLVTGEVPAQRPVTRSFGVFFDLRLNKPLSKQSWGWWFETPSYSLWRHCNGIYWIYLLQCHSHPLVAYDELIPWYSLLWRHNGRYGISNPQPRDCLLSRLFRHRSKKTSKPRVTGLSAGNSPVTKVNPC